MHIQIKKRMPYFPEVGKLGKIINNCTICRVLCCSCTYCACLKLPKAVLHRAVILRIQTIEWLFAMEIYWFYSSASPQGGVVNNTDGFISSSVGRSPNHTATVYSTVMPYLNQYCPMCSLFVIVIISLKPGGTHKYHQTCPSCSAYPFFLMMYVLFIGTLI